MKGFQTIKGSVRNAFSYYQTRIQTSPVKTKMITCFFLMSMGDIVCQMREMKKNKSQKYSAFRTLNQGGVVTLFGNPVSQLYIMRVAPLIQL